MADHSGLWLATEVYPIAPYANSLRFDETVDPHFPVYVEDVKRQENAKRALPSILRRPTLTEALNITRIYSVADALPEGQPLVRSWPFRSPHHTISHAGLGRQAFPRNQSSI